MTLSSPGTHLDASRVRPDNLAGFAATEEGRALLRQTFLSSDGRFILDSRSPLYQGFKIHYLFRGEPILVNERRATYTQGAEGLTYYYQDDQSKRSRVRFKTGDLLVADGVLRLQAYHPFGGTHDHFLGREIHNRADDFLRGTRGDQSRTHDMVSKIMAFVPDFGTQTRFLDLACGAESGTKESSGAYWSPWLLRQFHEKGMNVTGADYGSLAREPFKGLSGVDLTQPNSLKALPSGAFDLIHLRAFWDSPTFHSISVQRGFGPLEQATAHVRRNVLYPQIERLLAPGGHFLDYGGANPFLKPSDIWVYRKD